jgi:membrane associated rhomboid family serine protease
VTRQVRVNKRMALSAMPVTKALIAINAVIFLLGQAKVPWAQSDKLGLAAPLINPLHEYYRLLSAGFLHFGLLHIGFNMYCLWALGQAMEARLGPRRFAAVYFVALLGGSAGSLLIEPRNLAGGASGAVFGLFGALAVAMRSRGVSVMKSSLGPTLLINFFLTFAIPGISKGGHIGGFVFGALAGLIVLHPKREHTSEASQLGLLVILGVATVALSLVFAQRALT